MKKRIKEDLNIVKQEPVSNASKEAKKLGLNYVGFGRYEEPRSQQVTHIVQNDKLVPFNKAIRTNNYQQTSGDDLGTYGALMQPQVDEIHKSLSAAHSPDKYDDRELDSIYHFTHSAYLDVNTRLAQLPSEIQADKIEAQYQGDYIPDMVDSLDSAIKKSRAPHEFHVYTELGQDFDPRALTPGAAFKFKGFRSSSINANSVINSSAKDKISASGRPKVTLLQIRMKKNSRGLYAADFTDNAADGDFILPRGAHVEVHSGPNTLVGSDALSQSMNLEVEYYDCSIKG